MCVTFDVMAACLVGGGKGGPARGGGNVQGSRMGGGGKGAGKGLGGVVQLLTDGWG